MSSRTMTTRLLALSAMTVMALSACNSDKALPTDSGMDPKLAAQQKANLAALATERHASNARFDSLNTIWMNRGSSHKPMFSAGDTSVAFVQCAPLPFSGSERIIGPAGGVFYFGPHQLTVPAGALSSDVSIAVMVTTTLSTNVQLLPHGTQFAVPVKLKLAYTQCDSAPSHRVAYIDSNGTLLEWTAAVDNPSAGFVEAALRHFSEYAVAY